jgi:hypothetical protein
MYNILSFFLSFMNILSGDFHYKHTHNTQWGYMTNGEQMIEGAIRKNHGGYFKHCFYSRMLCYILAGVIYTEITYGDIRRKHASLHLKLTRSNNDNMWA